MYQNNRYCGFHYSFIEEEAASMLSALESGGIPAVRRLAADMLSAIPGGAAAVGRIGRDFDLIAALNHDFGNSPVLAEDRDSPRARKLCRKLIENIRLRETGAGWGYVTW